MATYFRQSMSPSKPKSSERQAARDRKASARQAANGGTGASAYNPSSGTFHTLEPLNPDTGTGNLNGRFKSIDDMDDNASSNGGGVDADCMSNNGSYSGESEDQLHMNGKDRNGSGKAGTGCADKRDKIRGKNERKHQRQKERRAQELRDKCTGYLMSRKLEALAQKLVAMGFSQERATMALIVNDGHVEQSVAWLLEGSEGQVHDWNTGGNPKIDISEELGQILEIEKKYNFSRPDIERAVVACEGDLLKALDYLRARNLSTSAMCDEEHNPQSGSHANTEEPSALLPTLLCSPAGTQPRGIAVQQPPRQEGRTAVLSSEGRLRASSLNAYASLEESSKVYAHVRKHPNPSTDPQSLVQASFPSVSMKSTTPVSPFSSLSNVESGLVFGFGTPNPRLISVPSRDHAQNGPVKEPTYMGQIHSRTGSQPIMAPNNHSVSSPAYSPSSWSHGFVEGGSPSSVLQVNAPHANMGWKGTNASKNLMESLELDSSGFPQQFNPFVLMQANSQSSQWNAPGKGLSNLIPCGPSLNTAAHSGSPTGTSHGLFTGWGARLSQSSVDWNSGPIPNCDYRNIDWSMNATAVQGASSQLGSLMFQGRSSHQWSFDGERRFQTGSGSASLSTDTSYGQSVGKVAPSRAGMQDNISVESGNATGHEWTSPFAGKALFSIPQAVSAPSL